MKILAITICAFALTAQQAAAQNETPPDAPTPVEYRFNTAVVSADGAKGLRTDFQQFGVSIWSEASGVVSTPAIGETITLDGKSWGFYKETAVHRLQKVTLSRSVTTGKGRRAVDFGTEASYDLLLIETAPAICQFDEPGKRAPYWPAADCLVDRDKDGAFDEAVSRKSGASEFKTQSQLESLPYEKQEYLAEMFYRDDKSPVPGISVYTAGWNENAMKLQARWMAPEPSTDELMRSGGIDAVVHHRTSRQLFDITILFSNMDTPMDLFGMQFSILDAKWETLTYRIDHGLGDWYKEQTIDSGEE